MKKRQYKYTVVGFNRYIPIHTTIEAESIKDAKIAFYLSHGDNITSIYRITKKPTP